jgi:hypothetical protein
MKAHRLTAVLVGLALAAGFAPSPAGAAGKATAKSLLTGDCFDGKMIEGKDDDNCQIMVTVTPKNRNVSAVLEVAYDEEDPTWEEYDSGKTRGGRLIFQIASTNQDEMWTDGVILYRVKVRKSGGVAVPKARIYTIEYVSAAFAEDEDTSMTDEEKAQMDAMDAAMAENEQNIKQQQPNADISSGKPAGAPKFDKAAEFNRACTAIGFAKNGCDLLVAAKTAKEALTILGNRAEAWCNAVAAKVNEKVPCSVVLPNVFPPF